MGRSALLIPECDAPPPPPPSGHSELPKATGSKATSFLSTLDRN